MEGVLEMMIDAFSLDAGGGMLRAGGKEEDEKGGNPRGLQPDVEMLQ